MILDADLLIMIFWNIGVLFVNLVMFICFIFIKPIKDVKLFQADIYKNDIMAIKDNFIIKKIDEEDLKKINRIQYQNGYIPLFLCVIFFMEIILGFYLSKQVDLEVGYKILLMFFLPIFFIVIDIKIYFKNTSVFKNSKYYNKRNGVFLDYKIVLVPMYKGGTKEIYYVVVGTFNDNNEPIVAQIEVAYNVFNNIKNNLKWNIVMYNDKTAGIV